MLVLPEPVTLFFMAQHPAESGLNNAQSMLGNGASILTLLVGSALTPEQLAKLASQGYTDPRQFFQAVIDGKENIWSLINLNFLGELVKMSLNSGFLVNALLLYLNGVSDCAAIPGGCDGLLVGNVRNGVLPAPTGQPAFARRPTTSQAAADPDHRENRPRSPAGGRAGPGQTRGGYPGHGQHPAGGLHLVRAGPGSAHL